MKVNNSSKDNFRTTINKARVEDNETSEFQVKSGLRRDPLSTLLFNLELEELIRNSKINRQGT